MLTVGLSGSRGRVNQHLIDLIRKKGWRPVTSEAASSEQRLTEIFSNQIDVFVDFSNPIFWSHLVSFICDFKVPLISGTTAIETLSKDLSTLSAFSPVLHAKNFSSGIFFIKKFLRSLDISPDNINIEEVHHLYKRDAPSGTALDLCALLGVHGDKVKVTRQGDVVGDHTITLTFDNQILRLEHRALSRKMFALGAFNVIPWLVGKQKGNYTLDHYFNEVLLCPLDIQ